MFFDIIDILLDIWEMIDIFRKEREDTYSKKAAKKSWNAETNTEMRMREEEETHRLQRQTWEKQTETENEDIQ